MGRNAGTTSVQISLELNSRFKNCMYLTQFVIICQAEFHLNYINNSVYTSHRILPRVHYKDQYVNAGQGMVGVHCENNRCGKRRIS